MTIRTLNALVLLIGAFAILLCTGCGRKNTIENQKLYEVVIRRIQSGEIKTTSSVSLPLPSDVQRASVDGEILVLRPGTNQLIVVFKTWRGKGQNMEGYLYAFPTLPTQIVKGGYGGRATVELGPVQLMLDKEVNSNWYRVSHKLD